MTDCSLPSTFWRLLFTAAFALSAIPVRAADEAKAGALPPAKEVVAKYVKAIGGREAFLKHSSLRLKGKFEMAAQGLSGDFEMWTAKPAKMGVKIVLPGFGDVRSGFDGKVGWSVDPAQGPMLMEGKMLDQLRDQAHFYGILHDEKDYKSMEVVEKATFDGKPAYKLKLVRLSGQETTEYFDVNTGLQIGAESVQESPMGAIPTTTVLSAYQKFGDIQMPTKMIQKIGPIEQAVTINAVEYDKVPDSDFALPQEIKALVGKAPAAK